MTPFTACPHCEGRRFVPGPQGGMSINVMCIGCCARFNIVLPTIMRPEAPVLLVNVLGPPIGEPADLTGVAWLIELIGEK